MVTKAGERRRQRLFSTLRCALLLGALAGSNALRGEVEFEPSLSVGIAHTDNLTLTAEDPERETIYQAIPAFVLRQTAARISTNIDYRVEGYYYDNRGDSDAYQVFNAALQATLDPDNFFFDLSAVRDQTIRDPEAPITRSNLPISTNRGDRDEYYWGPRFQYPIGGSRTVRGSYRHTRTLYEDESELFFIRNFDSDTLTFSIDNYRKERGFSWATRYSADRTDYGVFMPWEYRQVALEIGAWVGQGIRLFAVGGRESPWEDPFDASLEDDFWEVGFAKQSREGLSVELATGERTFGSSKRASLDYAFRRGAMQLRYDEQPMTQGRDPYGLRAFPDFLNVDVDDFLLRPGTAERFISKRLDWTASLNLRRTTLSLTAFDESREGRTQFDGTQLEDEAQSGAAFTVSWRAGARTTFTLSAERLRRAFGEEREQLLRSTSIGADYRLGSRTNLVFTFAHTTEGSGASDLGADYAADLASLLVTRTF